MPANFDKPTPQQFGEYLEQILGSGYSVTYIERKNAHGQPMPDESFYHIINSQGNEPIYANVKVKLPATSNFTTTYGGRVAQGGAPVQEYAPKLMTRGNEYGYVFGGTLERSYIAPTQQGKKPITGATPGWKVDQLLRGPTASFAAAVDTAFQDVREERSMGNRNTSVESRLFNLAAEGAKENAAMSVPAGTLLVREGPNVAPSITQNAAKSIQVQNVYSQGAGISELEQARRMNEYTYNAIQTNQNISIQPPPGLSAQELAAWKANPPAFGSNLKQFGYAQGRSIGMGESDSKRLSEYFHYASQNLQGYLPTPKIVKHLNLIEGRETADLLGPDLRPIQPSRIPTSPGASPYGYRYTTAQVGGRVPERALVTGTLYTSQSAFEAGGGDIFPENLGVNIRTAGFRKSPNYVLGENVSELIQGHLGIQLPHRAGEEILSGQKWTYANISPGVRLNEQGQLEPLPSVPLEERMGAHSMVMGNQRLVLPEWYEKTTGLGAGYSEERIASGELAQVTAKDLAAISARVGVPAITNPTIEKIYLENQNAQLEVNAKLAGAGEKIGGIDRPGQPQVNIGTKRGLPIGVMSWEIKSLPEKMITSLAAMNAARQERLLTEYATNLRQSEQAARTPEEANTLGNQAEGVTTTLGELRQTRRQNPNAVLDIDRMAQLTQLPAHELGRDILQRIFLGGRTTEQFSSMNEQQLNQFAEAPENIRNLRRYGIGMVSANMVSPVSKQYSEQEYQTIRQAFALANPDITNIDERMANQYGFGPSANGQRTRTYRAPGLFMTGISEAALEWSGGGRANAELMELVSAKAPGYASRLGMSILDTEGAGSAARSLEERNANPARWGRAQMAALTMIEQSKGTSGFVIPEATMITPQIAQEMSSDVEMQGALGRTGSNLAGLNKFEELMQRYYPDVEPEKLRTRPIGFETAPGYYLPSTQALRSQMVEDTATMQETGDTGEDVTRLWNMAQRALKGGIQGTTYGDPGYIRKTGGRLFGHLQQQFGLVGGGEKRKGNQQMFGSDVAVTNARYGYWSSLKQNEVYASDEMIRAMVRHTAASQGVELSPEETNQILSLYQGKNTKLRVPKEVKSYIREMGAPDLVARYPITGGAEASAFAHLVTGEQLRRRGSEVPGVSGLSNQVFRIGAGLSTIFQGDQDYDMLVKMLGLNIRRTRGGNLGVSLAAFDKGKIDPDVAQGLRDIANVPYRTIMERLFPAGMSTEFDPLFKQVLETGQGGMAAVAKMMGGQFSKAGMYPYEMLRQSLETYSGAKMQMGGIYNFTRAMEASQATTGWTNEEILQARRSRAQLYQPFLDITTAKETPMAQMYQTSFLSEGAGGYLGMSWGTTPQGGNDIEWQERSAQNNRLSSTNIMNVIRNMVGTSVQPSLRNGNQELPTPEVLASYFSPEGSRAFMEGGERNPADVRLYNKIQRLRTANTPDLAAEQQYYQGVSLQEAVSGPYQQKGLDIQQRARAMRQGMMNWYEANYSEGEQRNKLFNIPILGGMFGKALASKLNKEPEWQLPSSFAPTPEGQQLLTNAAIQQPLYNMMRGRLFSAETAMKFMRGVQNMPNPTNILSWGLGNIKNILGFGRMKMGSEIGTMYEAAMQEPTEIRASVLPHILGVGAKYRTATTLGPQGTGQFGEQALRETGAYTLANVLGFGNEERFNLTNVLFPQNSKYLEAGNITEAKLQAIMGENRGWKSVNPMRWNEDTGMLENVELNDKSRKWRSSFSWRGNLGGIDTRVSGTPDYLRLTEKGLEFGEIKTTSQSDAEIAKAMPGWRMQANTSPWIAEQLRRQAAGGNETAANSLTDTLAAYFPDREERMRAEAEIEAGRTYSNLRVVKTGSPLAQEIEKGQEANPAFIEEQLNQQNNAQVYTPEMHEKLTGQITKASEMAYKARPRVFSKLWDIAKEAPTYWTQRREQLRQQGKTDLAGKATAFLDTSRQIFDQMRSVGAGAQAELAAQNAPIPPVAPTAQPSLSQQAAIPTAPPPATPVMGGWTQENANELARLAEQQRGRIASQTFNRNYVAQLGATPEGFVNAYNETRQRFMTTQTRMEGLIAQRLDNSNFINQVGRYAPTRPEAFDIGAAAMGAGVMRGTGNQGTGIPLGPTGTGGVMFTGGTMPPVTPGNVGGLVGPPPTTRAPNAIVPPGEGETDPTARAMRFVQQLEQSRGWLMQQGGELRTQLRVTGPGGIGGVLAGMTTPEINQQLGGFSAAGVFAHQLVREGKAIGGYLRKGGILDFSQGLPQDLQEKVNEIVQTQSPLGQNAAGLIAASSQYEVGKKAAGKAGINTDILQEYMGRLTNTFKEVNDSFDELGKTAKPSHKALKEFGEKTAQLNKDLAEFDVHKAAAPLMAAGILEQTGQGRYGIKAGAVISPEQAQALTKFVGEQAQFEGAGGTGGGGRGGFGAGGEPNMGMLSRRMLSGFGLMYAKSIWNIATAGTQMGYAESLQEQQQVQGAIGQRFGGMIPFANPEQMYQRAAATYGGTGWGALRTAQANMMRYQPSVVGAQGIGEALLGGGGAAATAMMWMGLPFSLPIAAAVGGIAAAGYAGLQIYGAAASPEKNAITMAAQQANGVFTPDRFGQGGAPGEWSPKQIFNFQNYGYMINQQKEAPMVAILNKMSQYNAAGGKDLRAFLQTQGVKTPQAVNQYMSMYQQVQAAQYPNIPIEGLTAATGLQAQYGLRLGEGEYGTRAQFAAGLAQGIPYEQTALAMAYTPGANFQQQQTAAGQIMQNWIENGGLTQAQIQAASIGEQRYQQLGLFAPGFQKQISGFEALRYNTQQAMANTMAAYPTWNAFVGAHPVTPQATASIPGVTPGPWASGYVFPSTTSTLPAYNPNVTYGALSGSIGSTTPPTLPSGFNVDLSKQMAPENIVDAKALADFKEALGKIPEYQNQFYQQAMSLYTGNKMMGLPTTKTPPMNVEELQAQYGGNLTPEQIASTMRQNQADEIRQQMQRSIFTQYQQMGIANPNMAYTQGMNNAQLGWEQQRITGIGNYSPWALTQTYAAGMNLPTGGAVSPFMVGRDIWQGGPFAGQALNAAPFTVSGLSHPLGGMLSANMGAFNWGGAVGTAFNKGYTIPGTNITAAGTTGAQNYLMYQNAQNQMASAGIAQQQLALTMQYTPQMWAIQDQMRALGIQQTQWGFQNQRAGLAMAQGQFNQNMALNMQQSQMQRGWTQQDWGVQGAQRAQQWGWHIEDYQENLRFMTGRDRRLAERQMGRETIMHDQESAQIAKNQERQKELWKLEDQRFLLQKQQFEENQKFQLDGIAKQEEFFNERTALETQLQDLERKFQQEQWKLQQQSVALQAKQAKDALDYATLQAGINVTMLQQSTYMDEISKNGYTFADLLDQKLKDWITLMGGTPYEADSGGGGGGGGGRLATPTALGGHRGAGQVLVVGEKEPEVFIPDTAGTVRPWSTLNVDRQPSTNKAKRQQLIVVNIGNEELKRYVVDVVEDEV